MVLVRQEIGDVLRDFRLQKGRTLRQVAGDASVALGYLSEVERGQKEASSEILAAVADALQTPLSVILGEVSDRLSVIEGLRDGFSDKDFATKPFPEKAFNNRVPDTVPAEFVEGYASDLLPR
jgi:transcriptional regulator with XRE-family HTH domain